MNESMNELTEYILNGSSAVKKSKRKKKIKEKKTEEKKSKK